MEKTKKSLLLRSAGVLMGVSILSTCVLGGTLAKYTTSGKGTASASVAKFDVKLNGSTIKSTEDVTLNLFDTVYDSATGINPLADDEVASGKIAPGTWGKTDLTVKNDSEVAIKYTLSIEKNDGADDAMLNRLQFSTNGEDWDTLENINAALSGASKELAIGADEETQSLYWQWEFEKPSDVDDTNLGTAAAAASAAKALVDVTVTAEQIN